MCFAELLWWARRECRITRVTYTGGSGVFVKVLNADPDRFAIIPPLIFGFSIAFNFGEQPPANILFQYSQVVVPFAFTEDTLGDLITQPFWCNTSLSGTSDVIALSYDPSRKAVFNGLLRSDFSNIVTS